MGGIWEDGKGDSSKGYSESVIPAAVQSRAGHVEYLCEEMCGAETGASLGCQAEEFGLRLSSRGAT